MSVSQPGNVAYGFSQSLLGVPSSPIIAQRNPTTNDKAAVGTIWINVPGNDPWILTSIVDNVATWVNTNASSAVNSVVTDSGTAVPVAGVLNLFGGDNIVTSAFGNTIDVAVTPNIDLPATNSAGTQGIYKIGGVDFGFLFPPSSVYVGGAGNTTNNPLLAVHNVGVGESALTAVTTGNNNTAIGGGALGSNTTGLNNVALGYLALNTITTGDTNIALGNQAMENILDGNDNLAVGFSAGSNWNGTESSNIAIGHQGVAAEDNAIHIGTQGSGAGQQDTCYIAGINGVTVGSPAFVTIDSSTFQMGTHPGTLVETIDGDTGSATGDPLTLTGGNSGAFVKFAGSGSTLTLSVTGTGENTFIGENSGNSSISGTNNTAVGVETMHSATGANNNAIFGWEAGLTISDGSDNAAFGYSAYSSGDNSKNTAIGALALTNVESGQQNVAIGYNAGSAYTTSESGNIVIGSGVTGSILESNVTRIGTEGTQVECFIAGITGVTVGSPEFVTINSSTGQMGVATAAPPIQTIDGDTGSATGSTISIIGLTHGGSSVFFSASGSTVDLNIGDFSGLSNCIVGDQSGNAFISGGANTGLGVGNSANLTSGSSNVAIGTDALATLTDGESNVAIGRNAMSSVTHSSSTVAVGQSAATNLTTGNQNVAIGINAGSFLSTGQQNVIIGPNANMATAASYNIVIGTNAGTNDITGTESSNIYIANAGVNGENNKGRIGTTGSGISEITDCYIAGTVHGDTGVTVTSGALNFPTTTSSSDGVISQSGVPYLHSFGDPSNVFLGLQSGNDFTAANPGNTGVGYQTLLAVTAGAFYNTAMGYQAMATATTGNNNVGIGNQALQFLDTGTDNTAVGPNAGSGINGGTSNTCIGTGASATGGANYNTCIGVNSGVSANAGTETGNIYIVNAGVSGENNTIRIGTQGNTGPEQDACYIAGIYGVTPGGGGLQTVTIDMNGQLGSSSGGSGITTIDGDTGSATGATITFNANSNAGSSVIFAASGSTVDLDVTDANNNTIVGSGSGNGSITGTVNTAIGTLSYQSLTSGSQNTAVGAAALRAITSGGSNVAVGYNSMVFLSTGSTNIAIGASAGQNLTGAESNNIYIGNSGVTSESATIRVGSVSQTSCFVAGIAGVTVASSAAVLINTSTGQMGTVVSSRRYKENVNEMGPKSATILDLRPVTFTYKNDPSRELRYGLIAEEVDEVMPDLVIYNKAGVPETVKYHDLPILLLNELQKQHNLIADLSRRLIRLEERSRYESTR